MTLNTTTRSAVTIALSNERAKLEPLRVELARATTTSDIARRVLEQAELRVAELEASLADDNAEIVALDAAAEAAVAVQK